VIKKNERIQGVTGRSAATARVFNHTECTFLYGMEEDGVGI